MENKKINISELLKDCPSGMELYSPLCGTCVFDRLIMGTIICKKQNKEEITFTSERYYMLPVFDDCECMLFPSKDQRDWNKFHIPFKDGIYFIQDLRNESEFWNPNTTNTPTGTYFYRFIGRGPVRDVEYNGSVEILR